MLTHGIYREILGPQFEEIGSPLRDFLETMGCVCAAGTFDIRRRGGFGGVLLGWICGFPPAGHAVQLHLTVQRIQSRELWIRNFAGRALTTNHLCKDGYLVEVLGPVSMFHTLHLEGQALVHQSERTYIFGLALPRWLAPSARAIGTPTSTGWNVEVEVAFPFFGSVLKYSGHVSRTAC